MSEELQDDEIDLRELFAALWDGKLLIFIVTCAVFLFSSAYLHVAERSYTVSVTLRPTEEQSSGGDNLGGLGGLGGLASLAGVQLPSGGATEFITFQAMLKSQEVASRLFADENLIQRLFADEWDESRKSFLQPIPSTLGNVLRLLEPLLTGEGQGAYIAPNAARLAQKLSSDLSVSEDKTSGMLILSMESAKPKLASDLMLALIRETDGFLKERFVISGSDALQFYQQKISKARSREHREALAKLIATEEQKLMLATREGPFAVEILMGPDQSLRPTSPKSSLVLALGLVLGLFLGAAVVLMRKAFGGNEKKVSQS
ncbi:Wzz/FepE/Etk N-terminal domain-containing protein [Paracoccaceae bacterium]|nr:Wzz/FepE/Etk N-terminal domain-containing protein [Paracoccaceae bacterium]